MKRIALILLLSVCACSPKIIETVRTEYVYRDRIQVDTTYLHDSVYLREFIKGDTVRITEYRDRYRYEYKYVHDTTAVHDTTIVEKTKEVKVEKPLTFWQKFRINAFWWLAVAVAACLAWIFRKPVLAFVKKLII